MEVRFPHGHPRCFGITGDPHLTTFDDLNYDLQTTGEFIAVRSLDDNLQVQVRMEPYAPDYKMLSVATAVAAHVGERRVVIAARTGTPLRIDGEPVEIPEGEARLLDDEGSLILRRVWENSVRRVSGYSVVWPDGTNLHVEIFPEWLTDMNLLLAEARDGRVEGLGGNADGDDYGANDFRTQDGKALSSPPEFDILYDEFAESWRITQEESLFHYEHSENTETFTNREYPSREVSIDDLDPDARADAERRCRAGGVVEPQALEHCVFDVALTGDDIFIASALSVQTPPEFRDPGALAARLLLPPEVAAGSEFEVTWAGPDNPHDQISITARGAPATAHVTWKYTQEGSPMTLRAPDAPGDYDVHYLVTQSGTTLLTEPLTVNAVTAHLQVPSEVPPGSEFEVAWEGPDNPHDLITIAERGASPYALMNWKYTADGSPITLQAPDEPGAYEVRYVTGQSGSVLEARAFEVD